MKPGVAFGDHIKTEKIPKRGGRSYDGFRFRAYIFPLLIFITGIILLLRLVTLQMFKGSYYRSLSDSNRIRTSIIHAPRGVIFDRNNKPLVYNVPGYRQTVGKKTTLLTQEKALAGIAKGEKNIEIDSLRQYPLKEAAAHILGYVGQVSPEQLRTSLYRDYRFTDIVGKSGIEEQYERLLKGVDGKQLFEVDVSGKEMRKLGQTDPLAGQDVTLTVDSVLQQAAYTALADIKKGVVIASTPDGQILAMVSKPTFDPNLFTMGTTYKASSSSYQNLEAILLDGQNQPLLNRAIGGVYPPGSTFKIVTAASGLENRVFDKNFTVNDTGILHIGEYSFSNWYYTQYGRTEGEVDIVKAISRSNDTFFYKAAEMINVDRLSHTAGDFGIGRVLGIDLSGEEKGVLPTKTWKKENVGEGWYLGDTFIYGIGQGFLLTTPLQVNVFTQAVANGGTLYKPHFLKQLRPEIEKKNLLHAQNTALIHEGMIKSCSTGGVAWPFFDFKVKNAALRVDGKNILASPQATHSASSGQASDLKDFRKVTVACKTGTAQHGDEHTLPHAWITLFAPAYNPQIVVTVLAESSGEGSNIAAPVARKVLEAYFTQH